MATYLHLFDTEDEYNTARNNDYTEPWVSTTNIGGSTSSSYRVDYNKPNPLNIPLTFEITSNGDIVWKEFYEMEEPIYRTIEYSKNGGEWTEIISSIGGTSISVVSGDTVQFRGNNSTYSTAQYDEYASFKNTTCNFKVKGNIMSLINSTDFANLDTLQSAYTFNSFFGYKLIDASELLLPATTLTEYCYYRMFAGCDLLTSAPSILPATTLASYCYYEMFSYCTSLTSAPELPATTLVNRCYRSMFNSCTNLNYIKCLATDISATDCTGYWVSGVQTNSGTFVKNANMLSWTTGNNGIPTNWTVQDA